MLFNSPEFLFLFFPFVLGVFYLVNRQHPRGKILLLAASLFFYGFWNIGDLPLLLASILINYFLGKHLLPSPKAWSESHRKYLLVTGLLLNLSLLFWYKYQNALSTWTLSFSESNPGIPLALSFITFQQIAFLVDSYRGNTAPTGLLDHMLFISFFPQLIAGPIVLNREILPQLKRKLSNLELYANVPRALVIVSLGLFKKVVVADTFAFWADKGFGSSGSLTFLESWTTSLSYTLQLYYDFSGYSDIAVGLALFFGIRLPQNFNSPYCSTNIREFWKRWHITLSRFLKDYVYIPLGGSQRGDTRVCMNLLATCLLSGLWHGAGWLFLVWGFLHGVALILHFLWRKLHIRLWPGLSWFLTMNFVNAGWVLFRADDWNDVRRVLGGMYSLSSVDYVVSLEFVDVLSMWFHQPLYQWLPIGSPVSHVNEFAFFLAIIVFILTLVMENTNRYQTLCISTRTLVKASFAFGLSVLIPQLTSTKVFLYFAF